jgi:hypothetical protein
VLLRAKYGWPKQSVPFDPNAFHQPDGYRQDAAGFASMCWDIPTYLPGSWGGMTTVTLDSGGWVYEIPPKDLLPGDALGLCGPGTSGAGGVIVIFEKWLGDTPDTGYAITWEQLPEASPGPVQRARPYSFQWHAYRFRDIV